MTQERPRQIGHYRLDVLLGRGGMGEVYKAWDTRLERWVAVKRLLARRNTGPSARSRFLREARIVAGLGHPAIVQVHDILQDAPLRETGESDDWIVMELVDGPDLATLCRGGPLLPGLAADYGRQVAEGLGVAHRAGVVHRDLKTENVMVGERVKILDFGIARWDRDAGETQAGQLLGTPRAMAPEQAAGREVDTRSDLFALGVLLYEILTGRSPFVADSIADTLQRIIAHKQPPASQLNPRVPEALSKLVDLLLEKDPRRRPGSAGEVAEALENVQQTGRSTPARAPVTIGHPTTLGDDEETLDAGRPFVADPTVEVRVRTLLVSDLVQSTRLVEELGDREAARLFRRHDRLARDLLADHDGLEIDRSDGFLLLFKRPWNAVRYALAYHGALRDLSTADVRLTARVGIHLGEVLLLRNPPDDVARGAKPLEAEGLAKPTAVRLTSLAAGGQTLLTQAAFDVARRAAVDEGDELRWMEHGRYRFKGVADDVDVFEVGVDGVAPLTPPAGSEKAVPVLPEPAAPAPTPAPSPRPRPTSTLRPWTPPPFPGEPYPLLLPYTHPDLFAGREPEIDTLVNDLETPVLVTGLHAPSGTGKSSLILAGLVPRLRCMGRPVALVRHPREAGVASRLVNDLLENAAAFADEDWNTFAERLSEVERLAGSPPLLVLDQFEDVLRPDAKAARSTLGVLLAATARQRPGLDGPVCRWLLAYRKEYHGAVAAWLEDVLRDRDDAPALPHDLSGPERFQDFALAPLVSFQDAIERPFSLAHGAAPRYSWRFESGHAERLARAFDEARRARPDAPLTPELQVVLAHLVSRAGADDVLRVPDDPGRLVDEALESHLKRALESAFPGPARTERSRALLALRELATATGRKDEGLPVETLARAIGDGGATILEQLATPLTRLVVLRNAPDGPRYVLAHDRMAEVVVRVVEEQGQHGLVVDEELLALRRFVDLKTAMHRSRQPNATRMPWRHYRRIGVHREALLGDGERRSWWAACRRRRASDRRRAVGAGVASLVVLALVAWGLSARARRQQERLDLLTQVEAGAPEAAFRAVHELVARTDTAPRDVLAAMRKTERTMDILEHGMEAFEGSERSVAVLEAVELALPWVAETPEDPVLVANLVWALDYGPAWDPAYADQARELRDRVLAPLRRLRPPPRIADDDPDWVDVPSGTFLMGSPEAKEGDDRTPHEVTVSAFRMLRHEVTNAEYRRLVPDHPKDAIKKYVEQFPERRAHYETFFTDDDLPAAFIDWYQAYTYAAWIGGRLPTEAEWEYAARAGCPHEYCDREGQETTVQHVAWTRESSMKIDVAWSQTPRPIPVPVMSLEPNPWGIYDTLGNLWEWTADWYQLYPTDHQHDPAGPPASISGGPGWRVNRGWSFRTGAGRWGVLSRTRFVTINDVEDQGCRVVLPSSG